MIKKLMVAGLAIVVLTAAAAGFYNNLRATDAQAAAAETGAATAAHRYEQVQNDESQQIHMPQNEVSMAGNPVGDHSDWTAPVASGDLNDIEIAGLMFMREEEKLARDVYLALYEKWNLPLFQNIADSEQMHMDALETLLVRYGLPDPVLAEAGQFTDPELQKLYDELVMRGSQSLAEAIKVGGLIEEIDILDLETRLTQTDNADIQQVYNNLLRGSQNHLRSFTNTLQTQTGEIYQPQAMSAEAYQAALSAQFGGYGQGNGNGQGGSYGQGGGNGQMNGQGYRGGQGVQPRRGQNTQP